MVVFKYIAALPEMTKGKDSKLIVIPYEASALMGSLAGIKKIFQETT